MTFWVPQTPEIRLRMVLLSLVYYFAIYVPTLLNYHFKYDMSVYSH